MKIKVADLEPNPYRKMSQYPIDRAKVDSLKSKIQKTFFWDNLVAREHNGKYQLAYGHHRWLAIKELGIKEIDIPIKSTKEFSDDEILVAMADENDREQASPIVLNQTIETVKEEIEKKIAKCESWDEFRSVTRNRPIVDTEPEFRTIKGKLNNGQGVGKKLIQKFLGSEWSISKVGIALATLNNLSIVDRKAIEKLPTMRKAGAFARAVKKHEIPKLTQKKIVKEIVKKDISSDKIPDLVAEHALPEIKKKDKEPKLPKTPSVREFIIQCENDTNSLERRIKELIPVLDDLTQKRQTLGRLVSALTRLTDTADVVIKSYK